MSKADDKLRRKTIAQLLIGSISTILMVVFILVDAKNPLHFFSGEGEEIGGGASNNFVIIIGSILAFFFIFSFIFTLIQFLKKKRRMNTKFLEFAVDMMDIANIIPIFMMIFFAIDTFFCSIATVIGPSMNPTYEENDVILITHISDYERNDVVIAELPSGTLIVKRIVACEGDVISVNIDGEVIINGEVFEDSESYHIGSNKTYNNYTLKEGEYYLLGDNRDVSIDSRPRGVFTEDMLCGKVFFILSPILRMGKAQWQYSGFLGTWLKPCAR